MPVATGSRGVLDARPDVATPARPGLGRVRHLGADDRSSQRVRVVDATLACLASQGLAKTTLDDVAAWAGLSRATVYRAFPGGRDAILAATVDTEVARLSSELAVAMGEAGDLEAALVAGIVGTARRLRQHEAIQFLLAHEPAVLLTHLCFEGMNRVLALASGFATPFLARWLEPEEAARAAEWAARITFSYLAQDAGAFDPTDEEDVGRLVSRFVLPGILALRRSASATERAPRPRKPEGEP